MASRPELYSLEHWGQVQGCDLSYRRADITEGKARAEMHQKQRQETAQSERKRETRHLSWPPISMKPHLPAGAPQAPQWSCQ